jgi:uncharacterized protein YijF (DUF1287 family)
MKHAVTAALILAISMPVRAQDTSARIAEVLQGAYDQVGVTVHYDGRYRPIRFPGGDVPADRGVCTDVIVRAYRRAGIDLQLLVHQDMSRAFRSYPPLWGLSRPDPNIDHRRVLNLATFFARHGQSFPVSLRAEDYQPGDIVTWRLFSGADHIGLVTDRERNGRRLVVHNIGAGTTIEDVLFSHTITGHYRYQPGSA